MITRAGPSRIISLFAFQIDVLYYPSPCPFLPGAVTSELSEIIRAPGPMSHVTATSELLLISVGRGRACVPDTGPRNAPGGHKNSFYSNIQILKDAGPR